MRRDDPGAMGSFREPGTNQRPSAQHQRRAEEQKNHVPQQVIAVLVHVMDLQDLVVDGAFDEIEEAPTQEGLPR